VLGVEPPTGRKSFLVLFCKKELFLPSPGKMAGTIL